MDRICYDTLIFILVRLEIRSYGRSEELNKFIIMELVSLRSSEWHSLAGS